ncbi:MAG: hypothetical protein WCJ69_16750 [Betaproteobacteria bacterium]
MIGWLRPAIILAMVMLLIRANVIEFRAKRHADAMAALEGDQPHERQPVKPYRQTQNIQQLLPVIATVLFAILMALLWV